MDPRLDVVEASEDEVVVLEHCSREALYPLTERDGLRIRGNAQDATGDGVDLARPAADILSAEEEASVQVGSNDVVHVDDGDILEAR